MSELDVLERWLQTSADPDELRRARDLLQPLLKAVAAELDGMSGAAGHRELAAYLRCLMLELDGLQRTATKRLHLLELSYGKLRS